MQQAYRDSQESAKAARRGQRSAAWTDKRHGLRIAAGAVALAAAVAETRAAGPGTSSRARVRARADSEKGGLQWRVAETGNCGMKSGARLVDGQL